MESIIEEVRKKSKGKGSRRKLPGPVREKIVEIKKQSHSFSNRDGARLGKDFGGGVIL